jgi:LmbE family N-acetylglucosaminyl deacetylase
MQAAAFLELLRAGGTITADRVAVVVAHPDDETIGAGGQLPRLAGIHVLHLTTGASADIGDARANGFATPAAYGRQRRAELLAAMGFAGIPPDALVSFDAVDQQLARRLVPLVCRLAEFLAERRIAVVLTHPYEGGHPDHDATAFVAQAAAALLTLAGHEAPGIVEMAFYHAGAKGQENQRFPADGGQGEIVIALDEAALRLKQRMLAAYVTQRQLVFEFSSPLERFRPAPTYDFTRLPNGGRLNYEGFDWGMNGADWRTLAGRALRDLGLPTRPLQSEEREPGQD